MAEAYLILAMAVADEVAWVFVGVLIGVGIGLPLGLFLAQIILPKPSTVLIQKLDNGYIIKET